MRIKFNDKIYRLKEVESGVDSLMELVEEPKYKHGDFLMTINRIAFIFDREGENGEAHHLFCTDMDGSIKDNVQDRWRWIRHCGYLKDVVVADQKATEAIVKGLKLMGKRWNDEKKCIEDIPVYKDGDFVVNEFGSILIFKDADGDCIFDHAYLTTCDELFINKVASFEGIKRHATTEEKQRMIKALAERDKRWNDNKKCVEDIPKRKFKNGDKVTLKSGCTSNPGLTYYSLFDEYIGKELIVIDYTESGNVKCNNGLRFAEDWLEPWSDEPKVGDRVIAWDNRNTPIIGVLDKINKDDSIYPYQVGGINWNHAVKWDGTVDHLQKIRSGKV